MSSSTLSFRGSVVIRRPVGDVFGFLADPSNAPRYLGDVVAVRPIDSTRSRWTVAVGRRVRWRWTSTITELVPDERLRYEASVLRWVIVRWDVTVAPRDDGTVVDERMTSPGGAVTRLALRLAKRDPGREIEANLDRLRQLLETGRVTDERHVVGKTFR